jgi:cell division septum initiation protein DivIVA
MYGPEQLTPQRIRETSFSSARLGRRGADENEVRAFCAWVSDEVARMYAERANLEEEVRRLRDRLVRGGGANAGVQPEDAHVQAVMVLSKAQQTADRYVAEAQEYSREVTEDAAKRGDEVLREAQIRASMILEEAHDSAQLAAERAGAERDARPPEGNADANALEAEVAYLRTFSTVCRTHLRAYLESLTKSIEEWEKAEREGLATTRAGRAPQSQNALSGRSQPVSLGKKGFLAFFHSASAAPIGVDGGAWKNGQISSASARQSPVACISARTENNPRLMRCRITYERGMRA